MAALVTNLGEEQVVDKLLASPIWTHMGWGTGAAPSETSTDLATAASEARVAVANAKVGTLDAALLRVTGTITCAGAGKTITEVGLFTALATANVAGVLSDHAATILAVGEGIAYTIDINPE